MKRIAVLITVHNRKQQTLECLSHLESQTFTSIPNPQIEVYLTNDGCTDGTPQAIYENFPNVDVIDGNGDLFWNRGMYVAWKRAAQNEHDYYLWLNDDTNLYVDAIERLLICSSKKDDKSVIVGSCSSKSDKGKITYGGRTKEGILIRDVSCEHQCVLFNGNIVLIPSFVFSQIGFNDQFYRHALGDFDYGHMVYRKGLVSYIAKGVYGECDQHSTIPKWKDPNVGFIQRLKFLHTPGGNGSNPIEFFYYRNKNYGLIPACLTFVSNYLHVLFPKLWGK
jgi:GT2 family glycosyltransferase